MSLSEEFRNESVRVRDNALDRIMRELPEDVRTQFIDALHDLSITGSAIARVMTRKGHSITQGQITDYRRNMDRYSYGKDGKRVYK